MTVTIKKGIDYLHKRKCFSDGDQIHECKLKWNVENEIRSIKHFL